MSRFRLWVACLPFSVLPAPLWFLVSPLLSWALGVPVRFCWPVGCSRSPFRRSFWFVGAGR